MSNDLVVKAMSFIFEPDKKLLESSIIDLLNAHRQVAGAPAHDIMILGVRAGDTTWTHRDKPAQVRAGPKLIVVPVLPEYAVKAHNLQSDFQLLERDTKRAHKTLTQLVRGMNTEQDLRDSFPDCLIRELGFSSLDRTRDPGFRYAEREPRVYANILKDLDMIEGYFNARYIT